MVTGTVLGALIVQREMFKARIQNFLVESQGFGDGWSAAAEDLTQVCGQKIRFNAKHEYAGLEVTVQEIIDEHHKTYDFEDLGLTQVKLLELLCWRVWG